MLFRSNVGTNTKVQPNKIINVFQTFNYDKESASVNFSFVKFIEKVNSHRQPSKGKRKEVDSDLEIKWKQKIIKLINAILNNIFYRYVNIAGGLYDPANDSHKLTHETMNFDRNNTGPQILFPIKMWSKVPLKKRDISNLFKSIGPKIGRAHV